MLPVCASVRGLMASLSRSRSRSCSLFLSLSLTLREANVRAPHLPAATSMRARTLTTSAGADFETKGEISRAGGSSAGEVNSKKESRGAATHLQGVVPARHVGSLAHVSGLPERATPERASAAFANRAA